MAASFGFEGGGLEGVPVQQLVAVPAVYIQDASASLRRAAAEVRAATPRSRVPPLVHQHSPAAWGRANALQARLHVGNPLCKPLRWHR